MVEPLHQVQSDLCKGDGICVDVCPKDTLEILDGKAATVESRTGACILCGQCVAVCPTGALQLPQLVANDFEDLSRSPFGYEEFFDFLRTRRSVRRFKNRPVERRLTEKVLAAAATAPMGVPPHSTEVVVLDRRDELDFLVRQLVESYESMLRGFSSPVGRFMIKLTHGAETYHVLREHAVDVARYNNAAYRRDGIDRYTYGAPLLLLFHASRWAMSYEENAHLVCHHAMLAALSLGLGGTIIGLIPPVVDRSKALRERYGIPGDNRVITSLILGHPKYRYKRSIRRDLAGVRMM